MELKRRHFLAALAAVVAGAAMGGWTWIARHAPARWLRARSPRAYPGPVAPLDEHALRKPGPWAG